MQRPKTSKPKPKLHTCKIPTHIDAGVWRIIFLFIGINKDLARCSEVCKKWRLYFQQCIGVLLIEKKRSLEALKANWEALRLAATPMVQADIDAALELKISYETYIDLIPKKYSLFHRVSDLGKLNCPPMVLHYGIMAVMYLITDKEEVKKRGGKLDWPYCKKRLLDKNFMKTMKDATPETLTREKVRKFRDLIEATLITTAQLAHESTQATYMMEWALKILEYKDFVERMDEKTKDVLKQFSIQSERQKEIEWLGKMVRAK